MTIAYGGLFATENCIVWVKLNKSKMGRDIYQNSLYIHGKLREVTPSVVNSGDTQST